MSPSRKFYLNKIVAVILTASAVTAFADVRKDSLDQFEKDVFFPSARTDAVILIQNNETIFEKYDRGQTATQKHIAWSVAKSVMSLLYGVAHRDKKFSLDDSICKFGGVSNSQFCPMRFRDLLTWSSGIKWREEYEKSKTPERASILAMMYGEGRHDMGAFVLSQPLAHAPGSAWVYSSGDTMLASYLLKQIYPGQSLPQLYAKEIFEPIGMKNWIFEQDGAGTIVGAAYLYISPTDLAKIGQLILNRGVWGQKQILSREWFDFMNTISAGFKKFRPAHDSAHIGGGHWWLNDHVAAGTPEPPLPGLPKDAIFTQGHWGQFLMVVPSMNLVAVRMGDTRDGSFRSQTFSKAIGKLLGQSPQVSKMGQ